MNHEELLVWQDDVMECTKVRDTLLNDRLILKQMMAKHLAEFFTWDDIEFDPNFNFVSLKYSHDNYPVLDSKKIHRLGMDIVIRTDFNDELGSMIVLDVFPFGFEEDDPS